MENAENISVPTARNRCARILLVIFIRASDQQCWVPVRKVSSRRPVEATISSPMRCTIASYTLVLVFCGLFPHHGFSTSLILVIARYPKGESEPWRSLTVRPQTVVVIFGLESQPAGSGKKLRRAQRTWSPTSAHGGLA